MTEPSPTPEAAKPSNGPEPAGSVPTATIRRRRVSTFWLVPIIALGVVGYLMWSQTMRERGPMIAIVFDDAGGIEPGSEIIHRGVAVGVVREMALSGDLQSVSVSAELRPDAAGLAVEGTRFWVVRPEVSLQRIAGLETLVGPQYIALQPGDPAGNRVGSFVALDAPPRTAAADTDALRLTLRSDRLGNLAPGSPVLYREIPVGVVRDAVLSDDATGVLVTIDIEPRYAPLVHTQTKFWRTAGVGFDFGLFTGLSVEADSLDALLQASISFATPERESKRGDRVESGASFELEDGADEDWLEWMPVVEVGE
ncbi:MAG: paraquat-inducible protein B [Phycisphaerae bacterium]|nr:paraquat-inducible protein B [Phycisphaerae bacterium]MBM90766.1 paraquat-inducible protein B [Phycisphaerae bacterium]